MPRFALVALLSLAACGAEGQPQAPTASPSKGITITGTASMGVGVTH